MARIKISKPDGSPSPYFWRDQEVGEKTHKTVFKRTDDGVKRMRGVHFDAVGKKICKD